MPSTNADARASWDADDQEALALEVAQAAMVAAPLRAALGTLSTLLIARAVLARAQGGTLTAKQQAAVRTAIAAALAGLSLSIIGAVMQAAAAARALAIRQEAAILKEAGLDAAALRVESADTVLARAGQDAQASLAAAIAHLRQAAATSALDTPAQLENLAARMLAPVRTLETSVRWTVNRALNDTTMTIARTAASFTATARPAFRPAPGEEPGYGNGTPLVEEGLLVVWVAERDACLVCLALSGETADPNGGEGFDEFASFDPERAAPEVWPPGMPLMGPPRHPHCRCRLRIILASNTQVPEVLKREAERSVARGWSGHASKRSRLNAANALVRRANRLPRTVNERAARDVARGAFSTRHRPRATNLRDD